MSELKYKGTCEGGPWHGQWIEAEFPLIAYDRGGYSYVSVSSKPKTWLWQQRPELIPNDENSASNLVMQT